MKVTLRSKDLSNGSKSLYLDIYNLGKRRYEFLNLYLAKNKEENRETKSLAEKIRAKREVELANNQYGFLPDYKKKASFTDYFNKVLEKKKKWSIYHSTFKKLNDYSKGKVSFQEIDERWLEGFQEYLLSSGISQNSAREYFSVLKRILKQAVKDKIISNNPADFVSHIKNKDIKRDYLNLDEIKALGKAECKYPEIKKAFLFACFTGLRFSDIKQLKWAFIKKEHIELRQQKTQDFIYIPLSQTAKSIIFSFDKKIINLPDKFVFTLPNRWFTNHILKKWFTDTGINKNAHFHLSRHSFAVMNITQGAQLYTVSKLLGHKNLKTTEIYSKLIDEKKKEAVDNLPFIEVKT